MKLLVGIDANNVWKKEDGTYWCSSIYDYEFFDRYLNVFEEIVVATRVFDMPISDEKDMRRFDGERMKVLPFPMYRGMKEHIFGVLRIRSIIHSILGNVDCAIVRLPSIVGFELVRHFKKTKKAYAIEIVADPFDVYRANLLARMVSYIGLKYIARQANGVSYVTSEYLQKRYRSCAHLKGESDRRFESSYSTLNIDKSYYTFPRQYFRKDSFIIAHTANGIHDGMKGHQELIQAVKIINDRGYRVRAIVVGEGRMRNEYEKLVRRLDLEELFEFTGLITDKEQIRRILINSDIFLFPTKAEGLSRSLLEAMAVGLPCISSDVGGNVELLPTEYLLNPNDVKGFAEKAIQFIENPDLMTKESKRNIQKAWEYNSEIVGCRRQTYYNKLKKCVESKEHES